MGRRKNRLFTRALPFLIPITPVFQYSNIPLFRYLVPQVEQLVAAHPLQEELAVLLNFPPLEKAKADIVR